jgi:hypothetical protein
MSDDLVPKLTPNRYVGKVCQHHPDGGGVRYKSSSSCVLCVAARVIRYQAEHPDRVRAATKKWRKKRFGRGPSTTTPSPEPAAGV